MEAMKVDTEGGDFSLKKVQIFNWLLLVIMTGAGWLIFSVFIAQSIFIGGTIANISFGFLKKDLVKVLSGPLEVTKVRFFMKYYARLAVVVVILFFLVKYQKVHVIGLLLGLSTVLVSIGLTVTGAARKIYFNAKEAS